MLKSVTIDGVTRSGGALGIALAHNDVVHDATRNVFYASVQGSDAAHANRIATIAAGTGAVAYSAPVGSEPGVLAVAPGGQYLYVGLRGAGEVVKLALPAMTEVARIPLGTGTFGPHFAESIAVSPADADTIAVSLQSHLVTPRHEGVVLVTGTTIAPVSTQSHTGSNLVTFDGGGSILYGINNETTESGLREIAVAADGLRETRVVTADDLTRRIQFAGGLVYLRTSAWTTGLVRAATFGDGTAVQCGRLASARVACIPFNTRAGVLSIYDAGTFAALPAVEIPVAADDLRFFVPGAAGTLALSTATGQQVWLVQDARL